MKKIILIFLFALFFFSCSRNDRFFIVNATGKEIRIVYELNENWKDGGGYFCDLPQVENIVINGDDFEFKNFDWDSTLITAKENVVSCKLPVNTCLSFIGGRDFSKFDRQNNEQDFQKLKKIYIIRENNDTTILSSKTLADIVVEHDSYDIKLMLD